MQLYPPNPNCLVYLAGPIAGCTDAECKGWRQKAANLLFPVKCLDPMRRDYRFEAEHVNEIVVLDKLDIQNSDVVMVYHDRPSVGTAMEIFYAWTLGKPIIVVNPNHGMEVSPWIKYHATRIVPRVQDAVDWIHRHVAGA